MMSSMKRSNLIAEKWELVSLGDLVKNPKSDLVDGPFGSNLKASEYIKTGVPVLKIQNIKANRFVRKQLSYITPAKANELSRHSFQAGDLIITKLGDPLGLCCRVPSDLVTGVIVADLMRLRPDEQIVDSGFLIHAVNSAVIQDQFKIITKGTTRSRVNLTIVRSIEINLPPLNEQHRIVSKIEELFSELDDGFASLKTAQAQLKIYRQALLKHAFEGKLTAQWRKDHADQLETADQLLGRIAKEREAHYQQQLKDWKQAVKEWESKPDADKRPPKPSQLKSNKDARLLSSRELPAGWHDLKLSDIVASIGQGWSPKCEKIPAVEGRWGVIKTTAIQPLRFNVAENKALPSSFRPRKWLQIEVGDILITRAGPRSRCGIVCLVTDTQPMIMLCDKAYLLRFPDSEIFSAYIAALLNSPDLTHAIEKLKTGINDSGVNITQNGFLDLRVQIPPFKEQQEIHRILEEQMSQIAHMEQDLEEQLQKAEALRQSILKKAFVGQLVAQDPADEPAGVLLARIRAERELVANTGERPVKSGGRTVRKSKATKKFT